MDVQEEEKQGRIEREYAREERSMSRSSARAGADSVGVGAKTRRQATWAEGQAQATQILVS